MIKKNKSSYQLVSCHCLVWWSGDLVVDRKEYRVTLISAGFTTAACQLVALVEELARFWFLGLLIIWGDGSDIGSPWSGDGRDHVTQTQLVFTVDRKTCFAPVFVRRDITSPTFSLSFVKICTFKVRLSDRFQVLEVLWDQFQGDTTVAFLLPFEVTKKV